LACSASSSTKKRDNDVHWRMRSLHCAVGSNDIGKVLDILPLPNSDKGNKSLLPYIDSSDECGFTPLMKACLNGNLDIAKLLLDTGANPNNVNMDDVEGGPSPLFYVIDHFCNVPLIRLLLQRGANPNVLDKNHATPLIRAVHRGNKVLMELLVSYGADVLAVDKNHYSALHHCARKGFLKGVLLLLSKAGDKLNDLFVVRSLHDDAAIHHACKYGYLEIVKALVNAGCPLELKNQLGDTPLHVACRYGYGEIVQYLIDSGSDQLLHNFGGKAPLELAIAINKEVVSPRSRSEVADSVLCSLTLVGCEKR